MDFDYVKDSVQRRIIERIGSRDLGRTLDQAHCDGNAAIGRIAESLLAGAPAVPTKKQSRARSIPVQTPTAPQDSDYKAAAEHLGSSGGRSLLLPEHTLLPLSAYEAASPKLGFSGGPSLLLREQTLLSLASVFPDRILALPGFHQILDLRRMLGQGESMIKALCASLRKYERRSDRKGIFRVDEILLLMAQHWTDPDYPFWLMREPAATKVMQVAFKLDGDLSGDLADAFRDRRKKHFVTSGKYPILDAVTAKNSTTGESHFVQFTFGSDLKLK
jgi:hypothetical protein